MARILIIPVMALTIALARWHAGAVQGLALGPCPFAKEYRCGTVRRALDPAGQVPGTVDVHFAYLPHRDGRRPSSGLVVAAEGGPGYGSIGSREAYRAMLGELLATRDLLVVDNRGTGLSAAIDCPALQREPTTSVAAITACGGQLGDAADLYGSGLAADDLAAILDALHVARIDLYGDSYGTFFSQAFAGRHPDRLRSLVLDSAYPVTGGSPWYAAEAPAVRDAFDGACTHSLTCRDLPGTSMQRIGRLLAALRAHGRDGLTPADLAFVMYAAGLDIAAYRELDASARAYLDRRDDAPLVRLVRENASGDERAGGPATVYSRGLWAAASCQDNPQAYDMRNAPAVRAQEWARARERKRRDDPAIYAPFSIDELLAIPPDFSYLPACLGWPVASRFHPPGEPVPPGTRFPAVPALVLTGELDTITPRGEATAAAALFPAATHLFFANSGHVVAEGDVHDCASRIVRRFIATLAPGDAACARTIPEVRTVPAFALHARDVAPASPLPGNEASLAELRAVAAAVETVGDALARPLIVDGRKGSGLRGGSYAYTAGPAAYRFSLDGSRWVRDVAVSGTATAKYAGDGAVRARLSFAGPGATGGTVDVRWDALTRHAFATISGHADGRTVAASMPAP
jgi:pimeloyl-ACP methyl ester carboxylesterase